MAEFRLRFQTLLALARRLRELPALALCVLMLASMYPAPAGAQGSMGSESDATARISIVVPERATFTIGLLETTSAISTVSTVIGGGKKKSEGEGEDHQRRALVKEVHRVRQAEEREAKRRARAARRRQRKGVGAELEGAIEDGVSAILAAAARGVTAAAEALVGDAAPPPNSQHGGPQVQLGPLGGHADPGAAEASADEAYRNPPVSHRRQP